MGEEGNASEDQIHVAVSNDGTKIAGRVRGNGPPLVLVHGGLGSGEFSWLFLLPFLVEHFTCYLMSTRGRGLSGDGADHSGSASSRMSPRTWRASTSRSRSSVIQAVRSGRSEELPSPPLTCELSRCTSRLFQRSSRP